MHKKTLQKYNDNQKTLNYEDDYIAIQWVCFNCTIAVHHPFWTI